MGAAYFYHLTDATLEATLRVLIAKARQAGWRIEVRGRDGATLQRLDLALWQGADDAFPAHGLAGGPHDAAQPVLLCAPGQAASNGAVCVMAIEGAQVTAAEVAALDRTCILFDGHDAAAVAQARVQWKALTGAGATAQYWAQEDGRWTKKAG